MVSMRAARPEGKKTAAVEDVALSPAVLHAAGVIEARILRGEYPAGQMLPSERALAAEFGVSRVTVRQAIEAVEGRGLLVRSARCRPLVRPSGGASAPASAPPLPAATARRSVAVWLWPGPTDPGAATILRGIRRALPPDDVRIILECPAGEDERRLEEPERLFLERILGDSDVEGVILWYLGGEDNLPALQAVRDAGRALVFIDRRPPEGFDGDYVGVDNVESAAAAVRHLIERGHTRIAHVTNREKVSTVAERRRGYEVALRRAGLPVRPEWVLRFDGAAPGDPGRGERVLAERLAALRAESPQNSPTAVFVVNDHIALPLAAALRSHGLHVPEDIAVVGFDGIERGPARAASLTTIRQPYDRIGVRAAELLLERLRGKGGGAAGPFRHVVLEGALHVGASTCPTTASAGAPSEVNARS